MTSASWLADLDRSERGIRPTLSNAVTVLQHDSAYGPTVLWFDEFLSRVMTLGADGRPREWRDDDDYRLTVYIQQAVGIVSMPDHVVSKAVRYVAQQRPKHVVRDWLTTLAWDGEARIALAFEDHWGVACGEHLPCEYVRAASANFFRGLVARVLFPGCQLDTMVVFEGAQGIKKTSALRVLGGAWYGVANESVQRKDFLEFLPGKWVIEIGELDAFTRAEVTRVKTVISTPVDRYRPSYGRVARDYPRQCIFAGTTNKDDWGNDDTGLRRFWPMPCGLVNVDTLAEARPQLFAEAVADVQAGVPWWVMPETTVLVQSGRQADHAWDDIILPALGLLPEVTTLYVLADVLKIPTNQITRIHELTVGGILRRAGWRKSTQRRGGKLGKIWLSPNQDTFIP